MKKIKISSKLSQIGKAFMLPITILPVAGLLLGIGASFSNEVNIKAYPILDNTIMQAIFVVMANAGSAIFDNLMLIIAVGLTIGFVKKEKGTAALAALVAFLVMNSTIASMIQIFGEESDTIDTGAIGAIAIAFIVAFLHNKYRNIELPDFLGFFGGSRFIPIVSTFAAILLGCIFYVVWPPIQSLLINTGEGISALGYFGTFLYGFLLRLTGAVGLHHMIYPMFWWTEVGGTEMVNGVQVVGAQNIFFAQLGDPNHVGLYTEGTRFFAGRFATMMFGLPGAALAMYHCLPKTISKRKKKQFAGLFFSVALTSFLTGITEPLEFMFLFVSPLLYVWHAFLDGISFLIADIVNLNIGNTFSGGFIDYVLFGVFQGEAKTHYLYLLIIGPLWTGVYYFSFKFFILKFNILTPGRDPKEEIDDEIKVVTKSNINEEAKQIISYLGGVENIEDVDACITRLRVSLKNSKKIDRDGLMNLGASGIVDVSGGIQVIYGAKAIRYKSVINDLYEF